MESSRSGGRLKQRLARMFKPSYLLRSACNSSTSAATILSSTASSRTLLHDVAREPAFAPRRHRHRGVDDDGMFLAHNTLGRSPSFSIANDRRHEAPVLRLAMDCGSCRTAGDLPPLMAKSESGRHGKNKKKERRVRETGGIYVTGEGEGRMCPPASPSSPSKSSYYYYCFNEVEKEEKNVESNKKKRRRKKKKKKKKKKKLLSNSYGISSSSSVNSDDGFEFFTSEEVEGKEEETETFFSSRSFSSDSSEFYQRPIPNAEKKKNKKASRCPPRRRSKNHENRNASEGFRPLVSIASRKKKVKELEEGKTGFAVVKQSSDPYGDFRNSMVEMIVERQIFGAEDLERLLHSYLSLNSPHHHPIILQAFSDIWVVLFGS